uniref:GB1/RHD3-type G domain-containing protein n=1 Tax=Alexandrium monilatum TaxID=311494 RepID=A0A7S4W084_9DINO
MAQAPTLMAGKGRGRDGEETASGFRACPLQLIRVDEGGVCHVEADAARVLNLIEGRLAVVGVAGLYRTGKSYLLNRLLGFQKAFEIGPSVNPCTKGLWVWGQPVELDPDFHLMFLDTEGLGSTQRTSTCDMQIFSLCILLSSLFIYNSMGAIDEMAIEDLHLVLNLAKLIHQRGAGGKGGGANVTDFFPDFLWVLRDFHLRMTDSRGGAMTAKEYLENALRPVSGQDKQNELRAAIRQVFPQRDCMTIVRPCADEEDLRHVQKLPYEKLRPQFREDVEDFTRKVYDSLRPKQVEGGAVNGPMLVHLATEYCRAMNNGGMPQIKSAWSYAVQSQLRMSLKDAVQLYRAQMNDKAMSYLPMDENRLRELHRDSKSRALEVFHAHGFSEDDSTFQEYRAELMRRIKQLYDHVKAENSKTSEHQCHACAEELYRKNIEAKLNTKGHYDSVEQLMRDWEQVQKIYVERTAGPAQAEVMSNVLFQRITESVNRFCDQKKLDEKMREEHRSCALSAIWDGAVQYFTGKGISAPTRPDTDEDLRRHPPPVGR